MLKTELYKTRADGVKLYRSYSDSGFLILQEQTGVKYAEAIDIEDSGYTYIETDEPIEPEQEGEADVTE